MVSPLCVLMLTFFSPVCMSWFSIAFTWRVKRGRKCLWLLQQSSQSLHQSQSGAMMRMWLNNWFSSWLPCFPATRKAFLRTASYWWRLQFAAWFLWHCQRKHGKPEKPQTLRSRPARSPKRPLFQIRWLDYWAMLRTSQWDGSWQSSWLKLKPLKFMMMQRPISKSHMVGSQQMPNASLLCTLLIYLVHSTVSNVQDCGSLMSMLTLKFCKIWLTTFCWMEGMESRFQPNSWLLCCITACSYWAVKELIWVCRGGLSEFFAVWPTGFVLKFKRHLQIVKNCHIWLSQSQSKHCAECWELQLTTYFAPPCEFCRITFGILPHTVKLWSLCRKGLMQLHSVHLQRLYCIKIFCHF